MNMNQVHANKTTINQKLSMIRLLILDVDGVLTDGKIIFSNDGNESKHFNVKDGLGIKLLQQAGIEVAIITGKASEIVATRFKNLGVKEIFQGQKNKLAAFEQLQQKHKLNQNQIAYIGDDLPDLAVIEKSGFSAAPKDAMTIVSDTVDYVCKYDGGQGAVREVCDLLLCAKGLLSQIINDYMTLGEAKR